ncbi:MAG: HAMP domain-containing sensor histidine kinase [Myxococcota bacterium]
MSAAARTPLLDPASRSLLEGLGALHAVVVAVDLDGRLVFVHDPDGLVGESDFATRSASEAGRPAARALAEALAARAPLQREDDAYHVRVFETDRDGPQPLRVALLDARTEPAPDTETLVRKNEELETCMRSVSHDLRSPLVSVLGFARLMRDEFGGPIGRTGQHFLDRIEQAGKHMERLLDDLLELTRMEETPNTAVHVNPIAVLEQLAAEKKLPLDDAGISLVLPSEAPILVCDRTRLYQLFANLVGNAIRFVPRDGSGRIEVRIEAVSDGFRIDVDDNGPGIEPEDRERIFDPFRTAGTVRKTVEGKKSSGLGLAIVRKIVESHRGRIHVEEAPIGGAGFRVWLPNPLARAEAPRKIASA